MAHTRVSWRFTITTDGVQCVKTVGQTEILPLSVGSWESSGVQNGASLVEALVLFGCPLAVAGEKTGVYKNDYDKFKGRLLAYYD